MATVLCRFLGREAPALTRAPYPGELGQRILREISQPAWQQWLAQQTLLINENRLNPLDRASRQRLEAEMVRFLFEGKIERPPGYRPPED